jgi:putative ABC transport system permease protein
MFKNYLKIAVRNLLRSKIYSFINIVGLAVSISAFILIFLWVVDELSYDKFNQNADRIYRPVLYAKIAEREISSAADPAPLGETLKKELPEVREYTRIWGMGEGPWIIRYRGQVFNEKKFLAVDSSFFKVFTAKFIDGDPNTALTRPKTIVITETIAHKYFGNSNPIGKILNVNKNTDYIITGVIHDFPAQSHFHFDFLTSLSTYEESKDTNWGNIRYFTYILLNTDIDKAQFEKKINSVARKYLSPQLKAAAGFTLEQYESKGNKYEYGIESLASIHLNSHLNYELEINGDMSYIYISSAIAIAILIIAFINFVNLSIARSEKRAKEVGIRKTLGSQKKQITCQFIIESIITSFMSVALSIGIVELLLPLFNNLYDKKTTLNLFNNYYEIPLLLCLVVIVGLAAGFYPAFYLSSFQPVQILKNNIRKGSRKANLRSGLVIIQFAISIILIISTFIIYSQLNYVNNKYIGYDKEQIVVINRIHNIGNVQSFMHDLTTNSRIAGISSSNEVPSKITNMSSYSIKGVPAIQMFNMNFMYCDYLFKSVYKMRMAAGRFFSKEYVADTAAVVINESAARKFGINNTEGKYLVGSSNGAQSYKIIGIIKDFNFMSLHEAIQPLVIFLYKTGSMGDYLSVKIKNADYPGTISFLKNTWKKYADDETMNYIFLDNNLEELYKTDFRASKLATVFSLLAIFIACLGLLGLASYTTEQRIKEIGIRKVLGASVLEITGMLSKEFVKWIVLANVIAWPIAYLLMNKWLQNFAYKANITIWSFILSGLFVLMIALLTIGSIAIKAATANPVKSLKYE